MLLYRCVPLKNYNSIRTLFYISGRCYDDGTKTTKACSGLHQDGNCDPGTGYCGCDPGYKLNDNNDACVEGSYLIQAI